MRRALLTACLVGPVLLLFSTICAGANPPLAADNPAAPVTGTTGGAISSTPGVITLIADGMTHSSTFAGIVAQLLASDVLVIIEPDLRMRTGLDGYMMFITRTSIRRYLRVYFDPRIQRSQQIAILGHELWHALEVANHPEVVDQDTLRALYARIGRGQCDRWDSDAALEAGHVISRELFAAADEHR